MTKREAKIQYGKNFREAVARIQNLPPAERSAVSNRPAAPLPKRAASVPKRTA